MIFLIKIFECVLGLVMIYYFRKISISINRLIEKRQK